MDQLLFSDSHESQKVTEPFSSRQMAYIVDQNNGSYQSGQILIDTSSLSNSGKYVSYQESYFVFPLVVAMYPDAASAKFDAAAGNWAVAFKNGIQLIDSMSVEYNNTTIIQQTPYLNHYLSYKQLMSFSQDDIHKIGSSIGFYPDTLDAWNIAANTAGPDGLGLTNNRNFGFESVYPTNNGRIFSTAAITAGNSGVAVANIAAGTPVDFLYTTNYPRYGSANTFTDGSAATGVCAVAPAATANFGMYMRQKWTTNFAKATPWSTLLTEGNASQLAKSYFTAAGTGTSAYKAWYYTVTLRLKDLAEFFQQIPLVKSAYLRFIINCNVGSTQVTAGTQAVSATAAAPLSDNQTPVALTLTQTTGLTNLAGGRTVPIMVASAAPGQGCDGITETTRKLNIVWGIAKVNFTLASGTQQTLTHTLNTTRLYAPLYQMTPAAESAFLSANKTKTVVYRDLFNYRVTGIKSNGDISQLLTNGIIDPAEIVIMPYLSPTQDNSVNFGGFSPYQSVFAASPPQTTPLAFLQNFNIQLAGVNVLMINETYAWQNFVDEAQGTHCINGNLVTGLTSGLLSEYDWYQSPYYVVNLARRVASEDVIPKSVLMLGKNITNYTMDYLVFISATRSVTIDMSSGQLVL